MSALTDFFKIPGMVRKFAGGTWGGSAGSALTRHMISNMAIPVGISFLMAKPENRMKETMQSAVGSLLFLGVKNPWVAGAGQLLMGFAPMSGDLVREITNYNRSSLESRTMASVPFS